MNKRIITIFAGAGASKAVNPDQYPTTIEFFQSLPSVITNDELFKFIIQFLKKDTEVVDIELVLWRLEELSQFCELAMDQHQLPGWLLTGNRLMLAINQKNNNVGHLVNIAKGASSRVKELKDAINAQVYNLYSQLPSPDNLRETWIPLLKPLIKSKAKIEIVTTNYDVVLESALDLLGEELDVNVDTGWKGSIYRTLDPNLWTQQQKSGLLTKLHGSVNWTRDGQQIYIGDPTFKSSHSNHAIIYPGFKGRPTEPTFQAFHSHFRKALSQSDSVIFIGFAFRDEHINDLCDRTISNQSRVVTIDPSPEINLSFDHPESKTLHIKKGFDAESAKEALEIIMGDISQSDS